MGVRHGKVQEKLLCRDETLTLDSAVDIARTHEATLANMQQFASLINVSTGITIESDHKPLKKVFKQIALESVSHENISVTKKK